MDILKVGERRMNMIYSISVVHSVAIFSGTNTLDQSNGDRPYLV